MPRLTLCLFVVSLLIPVAGFAQEETEKEKEKGNKKVFSGPQPGEQITPFKVLQVNGPKEVKEVSIVKEKRKGPSFVVFMHKLSEPAVGLIMSLEWYANKQEDLDSHYVMLTEDREKTEAIVKRWAGIPLLSESSFSISLDGPEGPGRYGLNRNVAMTVLIAKDNTVTKNFVLDAPNGTDVPEILSALAKSLGKPAPSADKIRAELRAERNRRRQSRTLNHAIVKLAPNKELGLAMHGLLYREVNNLERVKSAIRQMEKWAGKDEKKREQLRKYAKAVLDKEFRLMPDAREELEKLAKEVRRIAPKQLVAGVARLREMCNS